MTDGPASPHDSADWFEQRGFRLRFGWGPNGLRRLAPGADLVVVVDVLSFSTSVDVALGRGAVVLPYRWHDGSEDAYGRANDAVVASKQAAPGALSLRPSSLDRIEAGTRIVLPSPNGSALTFGAGEAGADHVIVGCLRNANAIGAGVGASVGSEIASVAVIAAGERWRGTTGPLRPAVEDLLGAGAVLAAIGEHRARPAAGIDDVSPEARAAVGAFAEARPHIATRIRNCGSGRELIDRGFARDVELAVMVGTSAVVPTLRGVELVDGSPVVGSTMEG